MEIFVSLLWIGKGGRGGRKGKLHDNDDEGSSDDNNSIQSDNGNDADNKNTHLLIYTML